MKKHHKHIDWWFSTGVLQFCLVINSKEMQLCYPIKQNYARKKKIWYTLHWILLHTTLNIINIFHVWLYRHFCWYCVRSSVDFFFFLRTTDLDLTIQRHTRQRTIIYLDILILTSVTWNLPLLQSKEWQIFLKTNRAGLYPKMFVLCILR